MCKWLRSERENQSHSMELMDSICEWPDFVLNTVWLDDVESVNMWIWYVAREVEMR